MSLITVYGYPQTRSTRATWALEEAGLQYQIVATHPRDKKPEYLALNPSGKIPTLTDGDLILTESAAVCTYIAEKYASGILIPSGSQPDVRAEYFKWMFFLVAEVEAPFWLVYKHTHLWPEEKRVPAIAKPAMAEFEQACNVLVQHLNKRETLVNCGFTAADIMLTSMLNWVTAARVPVHETLSAYRKRHAARPALERARDRESQAIAN